MAHPTTLRLNTSSTMARYTNPVQVGTYVTSATQSWSGALKLPRLCGALHSRGNTKGRHKGKSPHECLTGQRVGDWLTLLGYPPSPALA